MKAKHIKSVLRRKFERWVESIKDPATQELVKENTLITGGSIASMLMGDPVNDYDVYFKDKATCLAVARYYVAQFKKSPPPKFKDSAKLLSIDVQEDGDRVKIVVKSAGIASENAEESEGYEYFEMVPDEDRAAEYVEAVAEILQEPEAKEGEEKARFRPIFLSSNAITLSDKMQIVIRFWGEADVIHKNYDFVHCTCSWSAKTGELVLPPRALEAMLTKDLHYLGGSKYPLCSIIRTRKFIARGWKINAGQYVKMAWDLNELDLSDIKVLEDQMVGVDTAYFEQVLQLLRDHKSEKVDGTYLMQVIDKVF